MADIRDGPISKLKSQKTAIFSNKTADLDSTALIYANYFYFQ